MGFARRVEKLEELAQKWVDKPGKLYPLKCDITKEGEIVEAYKWVYKNLGCVHVLVNNAGVLKDGFVHCEYFYLLFHLFCYLVFLLYISFNHIL